MLILIEGLLKAKISLVNKRRMQLKGGRVKNKKMSMRKNRQKGRKHETTNPIETKECILILYKMRKDTPSTIQPPYKKNVVK